MEWFQYFYWNLIMKSRFIRTLGHLFQVLRTSSYESGSRAGPVGGTNFVFCLYGKFNPGYRDKKKVQKGPQNTRGNAFLLVSDLTSHAQLKMFRHGQSWYPGWSVHVGKISSSVTEISVAETEILVTWPASLLIWTHGNFCKRKEWRGEISETEPARSTGLTWRGP